MKIQFSKSKTENKPFSQSYHNLAFIVLSLCPLKKSPASKCRTMEPLQMMLIKEQLFTTSALHYVHFTTTEHLNGRKVHITNNWTSMLLTYVVCEKSREFKEPGNLFYMNEGGIKSTFNVAVIKYKLFFLRSVDIVNWLFRAVYLLITLYFFFIKKTSFR